MKTREELLKDRLDLFETDGWKDLVEELEEIEDRTKDISTIDNENALWHAKGQLHILGYVLSLEAATKIEMEQLDSEED